MSGATNQANGKGATAPPVNDKESQDKKDLIARCKKLLCEDSCKRLSLYEGDKNESDKIECAKHKEYPLPSTWNVYILYIFLPSLMSVYAAVSLIPACINYDPAYNISLFYSLLATWLAGLLLLWGRGFFFLPFTEFCTELHRDTHKRLIWIIFLSYASILLAYEIYAYTLSGWAALGAFLFWLLYAVCYVIVFLERHVRPCPAYASDNIKSRAQNGCANNSFLIASGLVHFGLLFCCVVFNSQLEEPWRTYRIGNSTCLASP
jgi:hypothetical protein